MASQIPDQLKEVAEQVNHGAQRTGTVRTLLSWFGFERRGYYKVRQIRKVLNKLKLETEPDFEETWIDGTVSFIPKSKGGPKNVPVQTEPPENTESLAIAATGTSAPVPCRVTDDPTSRIGRLPAANRPPLSIAPDAEVAEAITLMLQNDYSQLPVMTGERDVKGMFSWKSLGSRLALGRACGKVREFMETAYDISADASLFEAIQQIVLRECVLVRDNTRRVTGIVTTADLGLQFAQLGEPFLLLGQIENHVRTLIAEKFTKAELAAARDPSDPGREIEDVADLTLGEYVRLLENPTRWKKLGIRVDRKIFIEELKRVLEIRNDVMHFDPDGVASEDLSILRKFARFLGDLRRKLA